MEKSLADAVAPRVRVCPVHGESWQEKHRPEGEPAAD